MKISIIHPSRGRAERAFETFKRWTANPCCEFEYILSLDTSDRMQSKYYELFTDSGVRIIVSQNRSAIDAINNASYIADGDIFIQIAEDFDCPDAWGKKIIDAVGDKKDWIMKTNDGIQDWIITLPIMDREYYNRFGYIYFTEFLHMFCDTQLTCVADMTARKIEADITFTHNHYSTGRSEKDAISQKADGTWEQGKKLFIENFKRGFDLKETPGKIESQVYWDWIKGEL